jgi:hypothetical protein
MDTRPSGKPNRAVGQTMRKISLYLVLAGAAFLTGCAGVKPWQRETLSRPGMQLDPTPAITACDEHIYFSREASKGGRSYGGGGCGCN